MFAGRRPLESRPRNTDREWSRRSHPEGRQAERLFCESCFRREVLDRDDRTRIDLECGAAVGSAFACAAEPTGRRSCAVSSRPDADATEVVTRIRQHEVPAGPDRPGSLSLSR